MQGQELLRRIEFNPGVLSGKPIIRGRRIAVEHVLAMLAAGDTPADIVEHYPFLDSADIQACVEYAYRSSQARRSSRSLRAPLLEDTPRQLRFAKGIISVDRNGTRGGLGRKLGSPTPAVRYLSSLRYAEDGSSSTIDKGFGDLIHFGRTDPCSVIRLDPFGMDFEPPPKEVLWQAWSRSLRISLQGAP